MRKKLLLTLIFFIIFVCIFVFLKGVNQMPKSVEYRNEQYRFIFTLPDTWKGYKVVWEKWEGWKIDTPNDNVTEQGPKILIRHPKWSEQDPYQDIPIMIFTIEQWEEIQQVKLSVSAAPIPPSELGHNSTYVFALPPRYNYAYQTDWEEVARIFEANPLKTFDP